MKVEVSFPGQDVLVIDATKSIEQHYEKFDYDPPFVRRLAEDVLKEDANTKETL